MKKDAANRADIVAGLEQQLIKGDESLVGNKGYRRFLANPEGEGFAIDRVKVEEDQKFDGVFVLQTNARLSPLEAMLVYKKICGPWSERSERPGACSRRVRSITSSTRRSVAMSRAAFSRWR